MFNKILRYLFLMAAVCAFSLVSTGQNTYADSQSSSAEVNVGATVTCMVVLTSGDSLEFGNININSGADAGNVVIDETNGEITLTGDIISVDGTSQLGSLSLVAPRPGTLNITYPPQIDLYNSTDSSRTVSFSPMIAVNNLTTNSISLSNYNEEAEIKVGGTLALAAKTMEGSYSGTFTITLNYT